LELPNEELKRLVHTRGIAATDQLLLLLLADGATPKPPKDLRAIGKAVGLKPIAHWNISTMLRRAQPLAINVPGGWEITAEGLEHLTQRGLIGAVHIAQPATNLRALLPKIASQRTRDFVEEAILCYEANAYRASTVLSWIGAVSLLYDYVFSTKLVNFNAELARRGATQKHKPKPVANMDDFAEIKEETFLDIAHAISIIGKSVKDELKARLQLRNGCGHPNNLQIGQHMAAAHLEALITNVFAVF
jgi:hypothetical protein